MHLLSTPSYSHASAFYQRQLKNIVEVVPAIYLNTWETYTPIRSDHKKANDALPKNSDGTYMELKLSTAPMKGSTSSASTQKE